MNLVERNANSLVHNRLSDLAKELGDGSTPLDLALAEARRYAEALRVTRAALAEALGQAGYTAWQADPSRVRLLAAL